MTATAPIRQTEFERVARLLGGAPLLKREVVSSLDAHDMLVQGMPSAALSHLLSHLEVLQLNQSLEKAVGMSLRTFQRRKDSPDKPLNPDQGGRAWKFAEILAQATELFGSQQEAEQWLERPAIGLNRYKPIDLLATPAGAELVETFLSQIEFGVYT